MKQSRSELLDWVDHDSGRLSVNPDAYFGLKHLEKPEGENTFYFFLEIERSGENDFEKKQSNFMRKMHGFFHHPTSRETHETLRHQQLPRYHPDADERARGESLQ